jgi:hypothetical protein
VSNVQNWYALAGIILTFLTALLGWLKSRKNGKQIAEVHILVNSQLTTVIARAAQLVTVLEDNNVPVPDAPVKDNA